MGSATSVTGETFGDVRYEAEIRRTEHGVAHIKAADLGGLGFGQGYACAADHLPTICDQVTKASAQRSAYLGTGVFNEHLNSDLGYSILGTRAQGERMAATQGDDIQAIVRGYVAGCNAWLAEAGREALPEWCRDAAWIRPLTAEDLFTMYADMALMASGRNLASWIGTAVPPGGDATQPHATAPSEWSDLPPSPGSNGWAIGRAHSAGGGGLVMANPHFPWNGDGRFWECHLTIPGQLNVYGASLIGTPGVQIGFNERIAWTHTFSRGHRFVLYRLALADSPTQYRYGDDVRDMESVEHTITVRDADGSLTDQTFTRHVSHYGPIVDVPMLGWSATDAYAIKDANAGNDRMLAQFLALDFAQSVDEVKSAVHTIDGLPWVNIMAADSDGNAWYSDPSTTPHLAPEADERFATAAVSDPITALFHSMRVALLDGSDPTNEWIDHPAGSTPGLVPSSHLPQVDTDEAVFNANDSYWIAHPGQPLPVGSAMCGLAGIAQSPRTRHNATILANPPDGGWTPDAIESVLFNNRAFTADELADDVIERLAEFVAANGAEVTVDGRAADLARVHQVLSAWDRTYNIDAVGAVLWREFIGSFPVAEVSAGGSLWAQPFDAERPLETPRGLATSADPAQIDTIIVNLARASHALESAGVAIDARLGDVQYAERSGRRIPVHGGADAEGLINIVTPVANLSRSTLEPVATPPEAIVGRTEVTGLAQGGYQCVYGASFIMIAELGAEGPRARGLLVYGQSGDPASPQHIDQFEEFAAKRLRPFRFTEADIAAAPELSVRTVRG